MHQDNISKHVHSRILVTLLLSVLFSNLTLVLLIARPMETEHNNEWWLSAVDTAIETSPVPLDGQDASQSSKIALLGPEVELASHGGTNLGTQAPSWFETQHLMADYWNHGQSASSIGGLFAWSFPDPNLEPFRPGRTNWLHDASHETTEEPYHNVDKFNDMPNFDQQAFTSDQRIGRSASSGEPTESLVHNADQVAASAQELQHLDARNGLRTTLQSLDNFPGYAHRSIDQQTEAGNYNRYPTTNLLKYSIPASKFLKHHAQLEEIASSNRGGQAPKVVTELSPEAKGLQNIINEHLFSNKLEWRRKSDNLFLFQSRDEQFRRFVNRLNDRSSWFTAQIQGPKFERDIFVVPHPSYARGNVMFDPESKVKTILLSFWTTSRDQGVQRLQHIGSASLTAEHASDVLKQARHSTLLGKQVTPLVAEAILPSWRLQVMPPRQNGDKIAPTPIAGTYATSKDWLDGLPLFEHINHAVAQRSSLASAELITKMHKDSKLVKETANEALFGGSAAWQELPGKGKTSHVSTSLAVILRSHKRSKDLYLTTPKLTQFLPYEMVLVPYQIHNPRARLFDLSLKTNSHVFTLWASDGVSEDESRPRYLFVGGGFVSKDKTKEILHKANSVANEIKRAASHAA